ncbi:hypothetical protein FLK61_34455 [Paenalkalicoccus suaedae]|uniref:Tetratricopeptide repeat protein n=1 Tax=Paenalkalicoccus suaedae TaxID=2592382 RepID=A0A859FG33_9BACI|nr:hypothetical protein [Paenalkalicoccus suaedae]QKS71778.1 hypothetical protein FLK61_34455 [Paenalkalicoccus suaedae]
MKEEQVQAMQQLAKRVVKGYKEVHNKNYSEARKYLEPLVSMLHSETKPNVKLLSYTAIAQIGDRDIEGFLATYEELKRFDAETEEQVKLKERVDEMFTELMTVLQDQEPNQ